MMKQIFTLPALLLALCCSFASCQKDYDSTPDIVKEETTNPFSGDFSCKIAGNTFIAEQQTATITTVNDIKTLTITGIQYGYQRDTDNYQSITIVISPYNGNGKYLINSNAMITYSIKVNGYATNYISNMSNENFHVTTTGSTIGTFNTSVSEVGNSSNKLALTEGKFDIQ